MTTARASSGTPITPVEQTATWSSGTPAHIAAAPCIFAASWRPIEPVAAFALPLLTTTARIASRRQRSRVSSTGAAAVPERVNRAALVVCAASLTSRPTSVPPDGLIPAATPAARKPSGRHVGIGEQPRVLGQRDPARGERLERGHQTRPSVSGRPNMRLRFWIACELVPFQRLSIAAKTSTLPLRGSTRACTAQ